MRSTPRHLHHDLQKGEIHPFIIHTSSFISAGHALARQSKPVLRLRVRDLDDSPIDWSKFDLKRPQDLGLRARKKPRPHQDEAIKDVLAGQFFHSTQIPDMFQTAA